MSDICNNGQHYLYRHVRLDNNEPFYIGIGTKDNRKHITIRNQYYRANAKTDRSSWWKKIVDKTDYEVEILLESDDYEFIKQKEIEFIALYGRRDLGKGTLVNLTDGGQGSKGIVVSLETREKLRHINLGKKLSEEGLANVRKSAKNKIVKEALEKEGRTFITNQGCRIKIIEYNSNKNCTIQFEDGNIVYNVRYREIIEGEINNLNHRSVCNIGYLGYGNYKIRGLNKKRTPCYFLWLRLIKESIKESIILCEEWHNFQNFAQWYEENYVEGFVVNGKLFQKEDKIYSPETCFFVPHIINNLKTEVYRNNTIMGIENNNGKFRVKFKGRHLGMFKTLKEAFSILKIEKELYIKKLAEEYKEKINIKLYNKLINYEYYM